MTKAGAALLAVSGKACSPLLRRKRRETALLATGLPVMESGWVPGMSQMIWVPWRLGVGTALWVIESGWVPGMLETASVLQRWSLARARMVPELSWVPGLVSAPQW